MTLESRQRVWLTALAVVMAMTIPGIAVAQDSTEKAPGESATEEGLSPAELESVLATLPVLGSGLNVTITRDDEGEIVSVGLDPSEGATQVKDGDHRVVFLIGEDGPKVVVKSARGIVQTEVKADDPADASGDGVWTGDVFGTGAISIPYTVAFDGLIPTITVGDISAPEGVTATIGEPKTKTSDDGDRALYSVKISLESGEDEARIKLYAKAKVDDEGETRVSVSATLLSMDRAKWWFDRDDRDRDRDGDGRDWDRHDRDGDDDRSWDRDDRDRDDDRSWDRDDRDRDRDGDGRDRDGRDRDRDDRDREDRRGDDD